MLSQTAEYAVRAALYLAGAGDTGRPVPAEAIATALGAPVNYMSKTLHQLARAGLVEGLRGPTGGFRLAVPAAELTVGQIVETFDTPAAKPMCLLGDRPCDERRPCDAHHRWTEMTQAMQAPLDETTIADLLRKRRRRA
jgi:Rrf2 family transcriptional regulator, iron-sulfur cluster assembly transcription factor